MYVLLLIRRVWQHGRNPSLLHSRKLEDDVDANALQLLRFPVVLVCVHVQLCGGLVKCILARVVLRAAVLWDALPCNDCNVQRARSTLSTLN